MIIEYSHTKYQKLTALQHTLTFVGTVTQPLKYIAFDAVQSEALVHKNIIIMRNRLNLKSLKINKTDIIGSNGARLLGVRMSVGDLRTFKSELNPMVEV